MNDLYTNFPGWAYTVSLILTMVGYLVLIVFPRQSWANFWFSGIVVPVMLGVLYTIVLLIGALPSPQFPKWANPLDFFTLVGLRRLFTRDYLLLAGFLDLLILPLMAAAWMTRKAAQIRMPYIFLLPCIILTFGVPGTGVVVFVMFASARGRLQEIPRFEGQPPVNTAPVFSRPTSSF